MSEQDIQQLTKLISELSERMARIEEKLSNVPLCGAKCSQPKVVDLEKRVDKIEGHLTWLNRLVIGAIIMQLLGLVLINSVK